MWSADETDERRSIDRTRIIRPRAPTPTAADVRPASIVIRSKSPRLVANPAPAPRPNVIPRTVAIRGPARIHFLWIPHRSIVRFFVPGSTFVQVAVSRSVARDVARRDRVVVPQIATVRPTIEVIGRRRGSHEIGHMFGAAKFAALSGVDGVDLSAPGDLPFSTDHGNASAVSVFVYVNAKRAGLGHVERNVRCIHFVDIAFAQFSHPTIDTALGQPNLRGRVCEI